MSRILARLGTKVGLLASSLGLAGCLDFDRLDRLSDASGPDFSQATFDAVQDLASLDLSVDVVLNEPFDEDELDTTRWGNGTPATAFAIDHSTRIEGSGSLAIDITQLMQLGAGTLRWTGTLPSSGSLHLRFYARYSGPLDSNVDFADLFVSGGQEGDSVTLEPVDSSDTSRGATVVDNQYTGANFIESSTIVQPNQWHCYELALDETVGQTGWQSTLYIDGQTAVQPFLTTLTKPVDALAVGMALTQAASSTAKTAWIDAVVLRHDSALIGCPY